MYLCRVFIIMYLLLLCNYVFIIYLCMYLCIIYLFRRLLDMQLINRLLFGKHSLRVICVSAAKMDAEKEADNCFELF